MSLHSYQYFFNVILKKTEPINSILKTLNWQIKRALPRVQGCCLTASSVFNAPLWPTQVFDGNYTTVELTTETYCQSELFG